MVSIMGSFLALGEQDKETHCLLYFSDLQKKLSAEASLNCIKHKFSEVMEQVSWQVGNGETIGFWFDPWCGYPLVTMLSIPTHLHQELNSTVSNFIINSKCLYWKKSHDGNLSLKDVVYCHCPSSQNVSWAKLIWNKAIPPSKSMLAWRCLHDKIPTYDSLALRGCNLPSMCSLCGFNEETTKHLFFECSFATLIWNWLISIAAIISSLNIIWFSRNQRRFTNKMIHYKSAIYLIIAIVSLSGNTSNLHAYSTMSEFVILKAFNVQMKFSNAPVIKEVLWHPPILNCIKSNCDGASLGNPGVQTSLFAELMGAMLAIEIAFHRGWKQLWLETDSMLVLLAFKSSKVGIHCADKMANLGLTLPLSSSFTWWNSVPQQARVDYARNRHDFPAYRFC
ncbi:hypothetical protein TSUD_144230 [Trifolium subterraneum]|uniref:Reverse transcriptase zinc-binding domain-containing protein n=1 Tax=Trifolium subterraneum TaxID=3900 RepID=A0A2Z6NDZ8_TRISU|nr:hypothetical protein TSUD_144230 [Trifolium subterraneum]